MGRESSEGNTRAVSEDKMNWHELPCSVHDTDHMLIWVVYLDARGCLSRIFLKLFVYKILKCNIYIFILHS